MKKNTYITYIQGCKFILKLTIGTQERPFASKQMEIVKYSNYSDK